MAAKRDVLRVLQRHYERARFSISERKQSRAVYAPGEVEFREELSEKFKTLAKKVAAKHGFDVSVSAGLNYTLSRDGEDIYALRNKLANKRWEKENRQLSALQLAYEEAEEQVLLKGASTDLTEVFEAFTKRIEEIVAD